MHHPTTSYAPPPLPQLPPPHFNSVPEMSPPSVFNLLAKPHPTCATNTHTHHTTHMHHPTTFPHCPPPISDGAPETEPQWLSFDFCLQPPLLSFHKPPPSHCYHLIFTSHYLLHASTSFLTCAKIEPAAQFRDFAKPTASLCFANLLPCHCCHLAHTPHYLHTPHCLFHVCQIKPRQLDFKFGSNSTSPAQFFFHLYMLLLYWGSGPLLCSRYESLFYSFYLHTYTL